MEQSKGLEVVETKDVEVGSSGSQPWKGGPLEPIVKGWFHKDGMQIQIGNKYQSGCTKLLEGKSNRIGLEWSPETRDQLLKECLFN